MPKPKKVALAYSGGLDTSIIIPWLKENYSCDVIAVVGDVGQGDDMHAVAEKAKKTGASKVFIEDLRQEFLTGYVFPTLRAGAVYEHHWQAGDLLVWNNVALQHARGNVFYSGAPRTLRRVAFAARADADPWMLVRSLDRAASPAA